jgi:hypothetical protein
MYIVQVVIYSIFWQDLTFGQLAHWTPIFVLTIQYLFVTNFRIVINYQQFASGLNVTFSSFALSVATFKNYIV